MREVVAIHFEDSFFEIFLPAINNEAHEVTIPLSISRTKKAITLSFEIWDNVWEISSTEQIKLFDDGNFVGEIEITEANNLEGRFVAENISFTIVCLPHNPESSSFAKYMLSSTRVTIGTSKQSNIIFEQEFVSGTHCQIVHRENQWLVEDNSKNGTYINGERVREPQILRYGDQIYVFGLKIIFMGYFIGINRPNEPLDLSNLTKYEPISYASAKKEDSYFIRPPRRMKKIDNRIIEIEAPPAPRNMERQPLIFTIGPAFTMVIPMVAGVLFTLWGSRQSETAISSPFVFMGIITSLTAAIIGVFWALMNYRYSKEAEKKSENKRIVLYSDYLKRIEESIHCAMTQNRDIINNTYPNPNEIMGWAHAENSRLWERDFFHDDFLSIRLGIGTIPSITEIVIPKERFSLVDDNLVEKPYELQQACKSLESVPVSISLMENRCVGAVSEHQDELVNLMRVVALNLSASHSYTDVKMVCVFNEASIAESGYLKWLPHVWDAGRKLLAYDESTANEVFHHILEVLKKHIDNQMS